MKYLIFVIDLTKKTIMEFNDFEWHDSAIRNIRIDRRQPGKRDIIELEIEFDDGLYRIVFESVYQASFQMNFGVIPVEGYETIYFAHQEGKENELVQDVYKTWKGTLDPIPLNYYEIETNSTGSKIQIVATGFSYEIINKSFISKWCTKLKSGF